MPIPAHMARRPITIRPPQAVLRAVEAEATHVGESVSEFFVVAGLARASFYYGRRNGDGSQLLDQMYEIARDLGARYPDPPRE